MAVDFVDFGLQFMQQFGLAAIIVLLILDGALLLPVFPGEIVLVMAISTYVTDVPSLIGIILLTSAAALAGSILLYGIVRIGGRPLVTRFPGFFMMPSKRRERLERIFQRPIGQVLVLVLRLIPFTRILVNIPAGLAKMPFLRFVVLSAIGITAYHAAFIGFAYAVNQPGSPVATQKEKLEEAYASPAWAFIEANQIFVIIGLLFLGVIIALRAVIQKYRNPLEAGHSPIGWLTTIALLWGGIALAMVVYMEPDALLVTALVAGIDIAAFAAPLAMGPIEFLWTVAAVSIVVGFTLHRLRTSARKYRRRVKKHTKRRAKAAKRAAKQTRPVQATPPDPAPVRDAPDPMASNLDETDDLGESGDVDETESEEASDEKEDASPSTSGGVDFGKARRL